MIPTAKSNSSGFTLLEMIIALFILSLLGGMAMVGTRHVLADEEIRSSVREFQLLAKTARKEAVEKHQTVEIVFHENSLELRQRSNSSNKKISADQTKITTYQLPDLVRWKIKRWGSSTWESPKDLVWLFTSSGLNAPHRFRFERDKTWMEFSLNPLTANPQEEDFYLP